MLDELIDSNGHLKISLYHGTSTIFLNSIKKNGLGSNKKNINFDLSIFKKLCDAHIDLRSEWWHDNSYIWQSMLNKKHTKRVNFRYGGTYLSPSKFTAYSYANNFKYGSELLSSIIDAYEALMLLDPQRATTLMSNHSDIIEAIKFSHKPLLLKINNVHVSKLLSEHDENPISQIEMMVAVSKKVDQEISWQQFNFLLMDPIPFSEISVV